MTHDPSRLLRFDSNRSELLGIWVELLFKLSLRDYSILQTVLIDFKRDLFRYVYDSLYDVGKGGLEMDRRHQMFFHVLLDIARRSHILKLKRF